MKTFKLALGIDIKAVVPDAITKEWREDATGPNASEFLKATQELFPDDDEGFTLHILKHGCRRIVRQSLHSLLANTGIGGTLSPVKAALIEIPVALEPDGVQPVLASQIDQALHGAVLG